MTIKSIYKFSIALIAITILVGMNIPITGVDPGLYASISKEMSETGSYLEVYHYGEDYLDKPPLLFWLNSLSFNVFGIHNWSFRLPSILFLFTGIYGTMRLGKLLYNENVGHLSAIIFGSSQAVMLISHEIKTDTILVSCVVIALWGIIEYIERKKWKYFVIGFVAIGLAMLCKGPLGLMVPVLGLSTHFILKKQLLNFLKWEWLLGILIIAIVISPMVYGLYTQFDSQPNKTINLMSGLEETGKSGLHFFFWEQSFGRLTGESEWNNNAPWHFFFGTLGWSFIPWVIISVIAFFRKLYLAIKTPTKHEFYTIGAILLPFIALSMSKFKLDHYIFILYPFLAIITASFLLEITEFKKSSWLVYVQSFIVLAITTATIAIQTFVFKASLLLFIPILLLLVGSLIYLLISKNNVLTKTVIGSLISVCIFNIYMKSHFYPSLAEYHAGYTAGIIAYEKKQEHNFKNQYFFAAHADEFDVYSGELTHYIGMQNIDGQDWNNAIIYCSENGLKALKDRNIELTFKQEFENYNTSMLTLSFLNKETRSSVTEKRFLIATK